MEKNAKRSGYGIGYEDDAGERISIWCRDDTSPWHISLPLGHLPKRRAATRVLEQKIVVAMSDLPTPIDALETEAYLAALSKAKKMDKDLSIRRVADGGCLISVFLDPKSRYQAFFWSPMFDRYFLWKIEREHKGRREIVAVDPRFAPPWKKEKPKQNTLLLLT